MILMGGIMMIKCNIDKLVMESVQGKIHHPTSSVAYQIGYDGKARVLPSVGGITYNVKLGDSAFGFECDHVEPGVSLRNENTNENNSLFTLSCIGNEAIVVSGDAKGAKGFVTGKHGGIEHILIDFDNGDLNKMAIDDKILIRAWGQGLRLLNYPEISIMNIDPSVFMNMDIQELENEIIVPVVAEIPAYLMGSGIGSPTAYNGDYDIMTQDVEKIKELGIDKLRLGDLVLIRDGDNTYGRGYLSGAVSIGVIVHTDCIKMGHGPGVTVIMSCKHQQITGKLDCGSNILKYKTL